MFSDIHTLVYSPSTLTLSLDICLTFRQWNISKQYQQRLVSACTLVLDFSKCFHLHMKNHKMEEQIKKRWAIQSMQLSQLKPQTREWSHLRTHISSHMSSDESSRTPTELWEKISHYWFKPLNFEVVCYVAIDNTMAYHRDSLFWQSEWFFQNVKHIM